MEKDPFTGEIFLRVIGRRRPTPGEVPSAETRAALTAMARYRTCAPKGIFFYRSHEEMDADRLRWTVQAIVEKEQRS
jgi:hypothetical protein